MGKTGVDGNRVTIEDIVYQVVPAGTLRYGVVNEFGEALGYFTLRGKQVVPDDFGVTGAPPIVRIAKLWAKVHLDKEEAAPLATKGICHIAHHEGASEEDLVRARARRAWLKKRPGMKASYLVRDPATGKAMTIAIWQSQAHLDAAVAAADAEGAELTATSVDVYPFVEDP